MKSLDITQTANKYWSVSVVVGLGTNYLRHPVANQCS